MIFENPYLLYIIKNIYQIISAVPTIYIDNSSHRFANTLIAKMSILVNFLKYLIVSDFIKIYITITIYFYSTKVNKDSIKIILQIVCGKHISLDVG